MPTRPDRIYVIDRNGKVAYKSKPGPFGFKAEELQAALRKSGIVLAQASQ